MALNVKFLQGTASAYEALNTKDSTTFYRITDTNDLYLGTTKLSNASDLEEAVARITTLESDIDTIEAEIGSLDDLSTTAKTDLVSALNELYTSIGSGGTAAEVTIEETTGSGDVAKIYTIAQGGVTIGTINIPVDLVVSSGSVVTNPTGMDEGTYIALTLSDSEGTVIYINAGDLVDIYTAGADATQVQLSISDNNVITASIVAGAVGTTELADDAVTTVKIADANVTLAKLSTTVQESIAKADTAVQSVATGTTNGTIIVDGEEVAVAGLGSAAYTSADDYDIAGAAAAVLGTADDAAESNTVYGAKAYADALVGDVDVSSQITTAIEALDYADEAVDGQYVSAVSETDGIISVTRTSLPDYSEVYDAYGAADSALESAKSYADEVASTASAELETALTWSSF